MAAHLAAIIASKGAMQAASVPSSVYNLLTNPPAMTAMTGPTRTAATNSVVDPVVDDDGVVLDPSDANSALQVARDYFLASTVMTGESEHNGFALFHPVGFTRKMDIKRKVDKYGAVCDDGDNMDVTDHISDARKNGFNMIVMGWSDADPDDDPSFLYHYECSDELYFTNQLPKGIVSMEVYADPSITCYNKSNVRSKRQKR